MRPFVAVNQALGLKSANLMRSKEKKNVMTPPHRPIEGAKREA